MQREDRNMNFAVKNNIPLEVLDGFGVGADSRRVIQRVQIGVQVEARLLVKRANLLAADRTIQLSPVVDSCVPGNIALGARLKFSAKRKYEWKVHLLIPQKLVRLLPGKIGGARLR